MAIVPRPGRGRHWLASHGVRFRSGKIRGWPGFADHDEDGADHDEDGADHDEDGADHDEDGAYYGGAAV